VRTGTVPGPASRRLLEPLLADGMTVGLGGKAGNASVALARLGAVLLIGSVGNDELGARAERARAREGRDRPRRRC
jgi:sugar/nucleoside kinase (ribokinase family)